MAVSASARASREPQIVRQDPAALKPRPDNPRTHSKKQIQQIAASIRRFGFVNPVLVDDGNFIVAGHGRVAAAALVGLKSVPTLRLSHLSRDQIRAYVIADNKLAENAGWDRDILKAEFSYLAELDIDLAIDTGFEMAEIDLVLSGETTAPKVDPADATVEAERDRPAVTRLGDIWQIGPHRLICGDSTRPETYTALLDAAKAQLVFTDPPYNVKIEGHVSGLGKVKHREFAMASGEMSEAEFQAFLTKVFEQLAAFADDGAIHFICMDWRHIGEVLAAAKPAYTGLKNLCVWTKSNGGMGSLYRSQHELVFVFKSGTAPHINNVELGKHGRYRTNVWPYAGINAFGAKRDEELALHPTVKPVALVSDAILDCSRRKGIVLDAFGGSGTTLVAAHRTGRCGYAIELDPHYCDVIVRRMAKVAKCKAIHVGTGREFGDVAAERAAAANDDAPKSGADQG